MAVVDFHQFDLFFLTAEIYNTETGQFSANKGPSDEARGLFPLETARHKAITNVWLRESFLGKFGRFFLFAQQPLWFF